MNSKTTIKMLDSSIDDVIIFFEKNKATELRHKTKSILHKILRHNNMVHFENDIGYYFYLDDLVVYINSQYRNYPELDEDTLFIVDRVFDILRGEPFLLYLTIICKNISEAKRIQKICSQISELSVEPFKVLNEFTEVEFGVCSFNIECDSLAIYHLIANLVDACYGTIAVKAV